MAGEIQLNGVTLATESGGVITLDSGVDIKGNLNATGSAPVYVCRAWVNFNGTGTVAIRGSGNVSSITDNGTGQYTVNFTTAIIDDDYSVTAMAQRDSSDNGNIMIACGGNQASDWSTTSVSLGVTLNASGDQVASDPRTAAIAVFR